MKWNWNEKKRLRCIYKTVIILLLLLLMFFLLLKISTFFWMKFTNDRYYYNDIFFSHYNDGNLTTQFFFLVAILSLYNMVIHWIIRRFSITLDDDDDDDDLTNWINLNIIFSFSFIHKWLVGWLVIVVVVVVDFRLMLREKKPWWRQCWIRKKNESFIRIIFRLIKKSAPPFFSVTPFIIHYTSHWCESVFVFK